MSNPLLAGRGRGGRGGRGLPANKAAPLGGGGGGGGTSAKGGGPLLNAEQLTTAVAELEALDDDKDARIAVARALINAHTFRAAAFGTLLAAMMTNAEKLLACAAGARKVTDAATDAVGMKAIMATLREAKDKATVQGHFKDDPKAPHDPI